jgi:hypothetical protein
MIAQVGLNGECVQATSDRHWTISQVGQGPP